MPLVLNGIRFETLPEIWTASPISSYLTYQQNVELEEYYEKYYITVGNKRPSNLPISRFLWRDYFASPSHRPTENIFATVIQSWKTAKLTFAKSGLQPVKNVPGSIQYHKKMLEYKNVLLKESEKEAAALNLLGASLSVSGSNPVGADSGGDGGSGDGAGGPMADESTLETTGRSASSPSCTSRGET